MEIKKITNQSFTPEWDDFVRENSSPAAFLQSWQWGQFRKECLGEKIEYFAVYDEWTRKNVEFYAEERGIAATALLIKRPLPLGKFYLNCPRGPIFKKQLTINSQQEAFILFINEIKKTVKQERVIFLRIAPPYEMNYESRIMNYEFKRPKILTHSHEPETTLLLDLTKTENELLSAMHPKTRYNIRLAERKGVKVRIMNHELGIMNKDIDIFYELLKQTAMRDKIKIFKKGYYQKLLEFFNNEIIKQLNNINCQLFLAEYENQLLSAIIVIGFGGTATYLHGASSNEHREVMPNHLIQWTAIRWAKEQGYKWYDFWGIQPAVNSQQLTVNRKRGRDWQGISRFKHGFVSEKTGQEINYLSAFDYVFDKKWYNLYRLGKILNF